MLYLALGPQEKHSFEALINIAAWFICDAGKSTAL